jgi:hypothetical protein
MRKTELPDWLNWSMSLNEGLFIGSVFLMFYAGATSFIPTAELERYSLYAAVVIGVLLSVKVALFLISKQKEKNTSRAGMVFLLLLTPFGFTFMWWLILVHAFSYWFTLSVGHSFEDVQIGITEYKRDKWGICQYRVRTKDVIETDFSHVCISKEFYKSLPQDTGLPFKIVGKRSLIGYAVDDVTTPNYVSASTPDTKVIEKIAGQGNTPQDGHITKIKYVANPAANYYLASKRNYTENSSPFKTITPEMKAILSIMKVGGTSIVQCPTLADCGFRIKDVRHPNPQPFILEIELISSSVNGA